jgi:hypothetical protein
VADQMFLTTSPPVTKRQRFELLRQQMYNERSSWIQHWQDLCDYFDPWRGKFWSDPRSIVDLGWKRDQKIVNGTGTFALRTLSAGLMSGVTPPTRPWFHAVMPDEFADPTKAEREWLDLVEKKIRDAMLGSNIYDALATVFEDLSLIQTAAVILIEDQDTILRAYVLPPGSYYIAQDSRGVVNTCIREIAMTVGQIVDQFGYDVCSEQVRNLYDRRITEQWMNVIHVVMPNDEYGPDKILAKNKKFYSCYYEQGSSMYWDNYTLGLLQESGFDEFPVMAPRWRVTGQDIYGSGPSMQCLGDVKMLQKLERKKLMAIDKKVDPPLVGPSSLRQTQVSQVPGQITYADTRQGDGIKPLYDINFDVEHVSQEIREVENRIKRALFNDLFLMLASQPGVQPKTAEEIKVAYEEKALILGPVLQRVDGDLLRPLLYRFYNSLLRRGEIPPAPGRLAGKPFSIRLVNILAQAQQLVTIGAIDRWVQGVGQMVAVDPEAFDLVDADQVNILKASALAIPAKAMRDMNQIAQIRENRAKSQQQAAMADQAQKLAPAAESLSKANINNPDSALTALLQRSTGQV